MIPFPTSVRARFIAARAVSAVLIACTPLPEPPVARAPDGRSEIIVYIVRHAEKSAVNPADPELTPAGYARADSLAVQLRDAGIDWVISSNRKRSLLTAQPLARLRNLDIEIVGLSGPLAAHVDSVAAAVNRRPGSRTLVVGHSNTVPLIIGALGGPRFADLCDHEHSNLFILTLSRTAPVRLLAQRYGAPDPAGDGKCTPMGR